MIRTVWRSALLGLLVAVLSCTEAPEPGSGPEVSTPVLRSWTVSPDLEIDELADGVWIHRSYARLSNGRRFASNGLLIRDADQLLLIDTAWGAEPTRDLLAWIESELGRPVRWAVASHHHEDRVGGGEILAAAAIDLAAHPATPELAAKANNPVPTVRLEGLESPGSAVAWGPVEVFYPGHGHAYDNVVIWHAATGTLFGGCAIRDAAARSMGNLADADLASWKEAIERVRRRYPEPQRVVPGHGAPGGAELLEVTATLLAAEPLTPP